ncbi:MAG: electron transfer flavoprotein subunit beta/FixA family protein [Gammaproteobacteria bacterium]|nr:electron transfer flavoprotein subunit beta/FixA family protein [Gammaproteobacteria bacterium]
MKILCAIKRVVDANVKVSIKSDGSAFDLTNTKMSVNPFCEIAVEEAIRLKETNIASEIVVVTIGEEIAQEQLRVCLALGADRGILVKTESDLEPLAIAKILAAIYEREQPDLVIFGKQSIDGDNSQTGPMFAALTNLPQGTFASSLSVQSSTIEIVREVDGGLQTVSLDLPATVTSDLRLNVPRFATLKNIMLSKKKPIEMISPQELNITPERRTENLGVEQPTQKRLGQMVDSATALVEKLKHEARVLD